MISRSASTFGPGENLAHFSASFVLAQAYQYLFLSLSFVFRDDMGLGKTFQCISLIW